MFNINEKIGLCNHQTLVIYQEGDNMQMQEFPSTMHKLSRGTYP